MAAALEMGPQLLVWEGQLYGLDVFFGEVVVADVQEVQAVRVLDEQTYLPGCLG